MSGLSILFRSFSLSSEVWFYSFLEVSLLLDSLCLLEMGYFPNYYTSAFFLTRVLRFLSIQ